MTILSSRRDNSLYEMTVTDYSKSKLLTYADSFRELANCMGTKEPVTCGDRQQKLERYREWEQQQALCRHMKEISEILRKVAVHTFTFDTFPERWKRKVVQAFRQEKIQVLDIYKIRDSMESKWDKPYAIGVRMYSEYSGGYSVREVADMLSVLLDKRLVPSVTAPMRVDREMKTFVFIKEPTFQAVPGYAKAVKENETVSGDNYTLLETAGGELSVLLADGMGSGENADRDSECVLELMEHFLEAGADVEAAMQMVNNALLVMMKENMSTLDVCTLDLYSGMCRFRKAGGVTTFLKSNSFVEQISIPTLPLGIFRETEYPMVERELIENDYVIMMTDGVIDALEESGYEAGLKQYIEDLRCGTPEETARRILQYALKCSGGHVADDMTVVVLGIYRNG